MRSKFLICFALVAGVLTVCGPMFAHHGNAAYSDTVLVLKNATVTKLVWANPHAIVMFDVKDDNGKVVHWVGEVSSPPGLIQRGWTQNSLLPGDVIAVYIHSAKNGSPIGWVARIELSDGKALCGMTFADTDCGLKRSK
jgi:hypothetical protein